MKGNLKLLITGLFTALASSLCCVMPVLALVSGSSGVASTFSWLEPFRPYLLVLTVVVLGIAWYQNLKPKKEMECNCNSTEKKSFYQSKLFLSLVTCFVLLTSAFPYYSSIFYNNKEVASTNVDGPNLKRIDFNIDGMTCSSCENHINHSIGLLEGVASVNTSYEKGSIEVKYDKSKTNIEAIKKAINSTGYNIIEQTNH